MVGRIDTAFNHPKYDDALNKLKTNHKILLFGECIDSISGGATPLRANEEQYTDSGVKFLRIQNIIEGGFDLSDVKFITDEVHNKLLKRSQLAENDLLMTITGRIGTCAIVEKDILPSNINQHIVRIRLKSGINPSFIASYLNSDIGMLFSNRGVTGTTRIALDYEAIKSIPMPIISESCQNNLINITTNGLLARSNKLQQANELLAGVDDMLLSALSLNMPDYKANLMCAVRLSNIKSDKTMSSEYYHAERMSVIGALKQSGIPCRKLKDVVDFIRKTIISENNPQNYLGLAGVEADTGELSGINEDAAGQAFLYEENDVLYGRLRPYLNKVLLAEKNGICSTEFHVMRVKHTKELLPEYLATVMRSKLIVSQTKHMMTGNTHPRISNDDVKNLYIPIPDITVQQKISKAVLTNKKKARQLKIKAEHDWQAAREQFEKELLGE